MCSRIETLKVLKTWNVDKSDNELVLKLFQKPYLYPYIELTIDVSMGFICHIYCWQLPDNHFIYKNNRRSLRNQTINNLIQSLNNCTMCEGILKNDDKKNCMEHVVHCTVENEDIGTVTNKL